MTTSKHSMQPNGSEQLTCWSVGHHASRRVVPGSSEARKMTAGSGLRLCAFLKSASPLGSALRTLLESETWGSTEYYLKWKGSATKSGRSIYRLVPSMPRNSGIDIGSWPTTEASAMDHGGPSQRDSGGRLKLPSLCSTWPTVSGADGGQTCRKPGREDELLIGGLVRTLGQTSQQNKNLSGKSLRKSCTETSTNSLSGRKATWPTPKQPQGSACRTEKNLNHLHRMDDVVPTNGEITYGCLALTEKFVVRLTTLSAWLMGYNIHYLKWWDRSTGRSSVRSEIQ